MLPPPKSSLEWCNSNRDLPKSTLCMNSWWLGTAEVSYKKAHILVEVEMSSHLFFCKLKWAFLWLTSAVPNHQEFMQRVDLGKSLLRNTINQLLQSEENREERTRLQIWSKYFGELELSVNVSMFIGAGPMGCSFHIGYSKTKGNFLDHLRINFKD